MRISGLLFSENVVLLSDKQFALLRCIDGVRCMKEIVRSSGITYAHAFKLFSWFEIRGLVVIRELDGRTRQVVLTPVGKKVLDLYFQVFNILKDVREVDRT